MSKVVIILSGGMDSTTLAYDLASQGHELHALSFVYGQRHYKEILAAMETTKKLGISHFVVPIHQDLLNNSALTGSEAIPEGHYADENMKKTVVPNRNMLMMSMAIAYAINIGADTVAYGAHAGDHAIYPDCRPEFFTALQGVAALCHFEPIHLIAPYMGIDKGDIAIRGRDLAVPYGDTWTCYKGGETPCGVCGACVERAEAFEKAGILDSLLEGV